MFNLCTPEPSFTASVLNVVDGSVMRTIKAIHQNAAPFTKGCFLEIDLTILTAAEWLIRANYSINELLIKKAKRPNLGQTFTIR